MSKAEILKQKLVSAYIYGEHMSNKTYVDTLNGYANEVSREGFRTGFNVGVKFSEILPNTPQPRDYADKLFDKWWIKEQEGER